MPRFPFGGVLLEMEEKKITYLYNAYLAGLLDSGELEEFKGLVMAENQALLRKLIDADWNRFQEIQAPQDLKEQVLQLVAATPQQVPDPIRRKFRSLTGIAAAIAVIALGTWMYTSGIFDWHHEDKAAFPTYTNDVAPGKNTAMLTLANGKTINLSDAKSAVIIDKHQLRYNDGTFLTSSGNNGQVKTLAVSTPPGGTYQVVLSDGTRVWLNAASKISFPSKFLGRKRSVVLTGEAYLEVAKDKAHPFIVESNGQQLEVLGTHFNINSYTDEECIKTTLLEGSVRVTSSTAPSSGNVTLKPGQQAMLKGGALQVKAADTEEATAWKNGQFMFDQENIRDIMRMVARWYNVEVVYKGPVTDELFGGAVNRFEHVSEVLKMLQLTGKVRFEINGRTITVTQ